MVKSNEVTMALCEEIFEKDGQNNNWAAPEHYSIIPFHKLLFVQDTYIISDSS